MARRLRSRPTAWIKPKRKTARSNRSRGFVETLPGSRSHTVFKHAGIGAFDNMPEIIVPPDSLFVMGDNRDNSADSRIAVDAGGVGLLPVGDLVGRVEALVGSWDLAVKRQPVWAWPSGFRLSRFFTTVQ
jgi:signal peptidase I